QLSAFAAISLAAGSKKRHQRQVSRGRSETSDSRKNLNDNNNVSTFKLQEFCFTFICEVGGGERGEAKETEAKGC
ncbi:hypothetical protein TrRE_jg1739, partial [Triparma retinervis]